MEPASKSQMFFAFLRVQLVLFALTISSFLIWDSFFNGPDTTVRKVTSIIIFILSIVLLFIESTIDTIDRDSFFED
ncbi:hypothetical protein AKUA2003_01070 [Apilactobacillus kunkeei]|nr:hypothetical protein AKUA2003_01070 [Apilactobacillus kunkeei]CAI2554938.1 hypothetical protein AKUA1001_01060 [Apilactobacillus kunkeei]CAI2801060.1 hypothetical protein AKUA2002_01070 [Apilactobacillus kunkeei]